MNKFCRFGCLVAVLLVLASGISCFAKTEVDSFPYDWESLNSKEHIVYADQWEYPIVDGERSSGKPLGDVVYTEKHEFEDGVCIYCGYKRKSSSPSRIISSGISTGVDISKLDSEVKTFEADASDVENGDVLITANGVKLTKGSTVDVVMKQVFLSLSADSHVRMYVVDSSVVNQLMPLINNNASLDEYGAWLSNFQVETVNGCECYVVIMSYVDNGNNFVMETYAFDKEDLALVDIL